MSLSLDIYFFPHVAVTANASFVKNLDGYDADKCKFEGTLEFETPDALQGNFLLRMSSDGDNAIPYDIIVHAFAAFSIHTDLSVSGNVYTQVFDNRVDSLKRSAIAMVYGALREFIASTTGRQPWGSFMIPTIFPSEVDVQLLLTDELQGVRDSLVDLDDSRPKVQIRKPAEGKSAAKASKKATKRVAK